MDTQLTLEALEPLLLLQVSPGPKIPKPEISSNPEFQKVVLHPPNHHKPPKQPMLQADPKEPGGIEGWIESHYIYLTHSHWHPPHVAHAHIPHSPHSHREWAEKERVEEKTEPKKVEEPGKTLLDLFDQENEIEEILISHLGFFAQEPEPNDAPQKLVNEPLPVTYKLADHVYLQLMPASGEYGFLNPEKKDLTMMLGLSMLVTAPTCGEPEKNKQIAT